MRKLILQMQVSVDGFVGGPQGEMNWLDVNWGEDINAYVTALTSTIDCIVMGHNLAKGFIPHWQSVADTAAANNPFAKIMDETPKIVFSRNADALSKSLSSLGWRNTNIATGSLQDEIGALKNATGKNIMVYGGSEFVGELAKANLIDEYYLFINPSALGKGMGIFNRLQSSLPLQCESTQRFDNGIVVIKYRKS
jgi:dihydrofolate reductase